MIPLLQQYCSGKHVSRLDANKAFAYVLDYLPEEMTNILSTYRDSAGAIFLRENAAAGVGGWVGGRV